MSSSTEEYVEGFVCMDADIKENEMKQFELTDYGKVLVVRQGGKLTAVGSKCTHYGAPLVSGALGQGRVRCPWHGACFNITTGDIEDFPGLDSLPCYQVSVETDGQVKVRAKISELESNRRVQTMTLRESNNNETFVIVGGGPSAAACVETLRQNSFGGRIIMITKENALPYDRVKISKALDTPVEKLQLRNEEFYNKNDIEVLRGVEVTSVDCENKTVKVSDGDCISFSTLYLATGSKSKRLPISGSELGNVFTLRTCSDGTAIHSAIGKNADRHVVILGVSFIGMEAAAYCVGKAKSITMIGRDDVPFRPVFGHSVGASLMKLFIDKGVVFKMNSNIKSCLGEDGKITSVELNDGCVLAADVLLMGVGSSFNTEFIRGSAIEMEPDGSIPVNDKLQTNIQCVFAGGDIAKAPVYSYGGKKASIGHYGLAHYHGKIAALNMLDKSAPLKAVPFFWTMVFGKSIRYCGYGKFHSMQVEGDVDNLKFVAFYFDESGKVISMASCQRDPIVAQFAEYLSQGKTLHKDNLAPDPFAWVNDVANAN
ncbi:apoptosis-inducing factor 3-like isoform X2 [Arctopsyche grandis]